MRRTRSSQEGFTLIELMIVVAIISVLGLMVLPKFGAMVQKSKEAATKGHLGTVRGAIRLYSADNDESFPASYWALRPKYIQATAPLLYTTQHPLSESVDDLPAWDPASDAARWGYVTAGAEAGHFGAQCTHGDLQGTIWSAQ